MDCGTCGHRRPNLWAGRCAKRKINIGEPIWGPTVRASEGCEQWEPIGTWRRFMNWLFKPPA